MVFRVISDKGFPFGVKTVHNQTGPTDQIKLDFFREVLIPFPYQGKARVPTVTGALKQVLKRSTRRS